MLLSIFDQANRQENHPIMNVKETDFPERFRPNIRCLRAAAQEKEVRDMMTVVDDFVVEINDFWASNYRGYKAKGRCCPALIEFGLVGRR